MMSQLTMREQSWVRKDEARSFCFTRVTSLSDLTESTVCFTRVTSLSRRFVFTMVRDLVYGVGTLWTGLLQLLSESSDRESTK